MSSKELPTTLDGVLERVVRATEKKKKEAKVVPLLNHLFRLWPDHLSPDSALVLLPLLGHESRHVARMSFFIVSDRRWTGATQEVRRHVAEAIKKEVYSPVILRNLFGLRCLESLTQADANDTILMECATDILNKYLEDKSKAAPSGTTKDKRKTLSSKDAAEQRSQELVQAAAFAALRTRPSVDSALWETVVRGILSGEPLTVRHALALGLRIAKQDASACASLFEPLIGAEKAKVLESLAEDVSGRCYLVRIFAHLANDTRVARADAFYLELRGFLVDESDRVAIEAIEGIVRGGWGRLQAATMPVRDEKNELIPVLSVIISKLSQLLQSAKTPEQHVAIRMTKLLAKTYIVYFEKQESILEFSRPVGDPSMADGSSESLDTSATTSDDTDVAPLDARLRKRGSTKRPGAAGSSKSAGKKVSRSTSSEASGGKDLEGSSSASGGKRTSHALSLEVSKDKSSGSSGNAPVSPRKTSNPPPPLDKQNRLAVRKATAKRRSTAEMEETIRRQRQEDVEKNHPLTELRTNILAIFKSRGCISVRLKSLTTLIWLTFSWNARKLEETILAERRSLAPHLFDEICEELNLRVKVTPELADSVLSIFYHLFCSVPAKMNTAIMFNVWKSIMETRLGKQKVLLSCFQMLDQLHNKETRLITFQVHKQIYWFLGEHANALTGEHISAGRNGTLRGNAMQAEENNSDDEIRLARIEPETEIQNRSMKSIVLRLEQGVAFGPFEIRAVCIEALAKIAFRSSWPLRLHLFEFMTLVANEPGGALTHLCVPMLRLLDRVFELRNDWVTVFERGASASDDEKKTLKRDVDDLQQQISSLCKVEQCILGTDFAEWANK
eukprot:TRINITY_DN7980_c0_g1_i1.p1 TRINITY_DN7980_c0_g1~~TRINITY_DN7980_c0_g1_i1.p1  ORF type:complete len:845 (+),score=176.75 TRINITY_DN7980_c0_g1_i1:92-2626(+)